MGLYLALPYAARGLSRLLSAPGGVALSWLWRERRPGLRRGSADPRAEST